MPYIHFQGDQAKALTFYAGVIGGTDLRMMRYAKGPQVPGAWQASDRILQGQVTIPGGTGMASDYPPGVAGDPQSGFSVLQTVPDVAGARRIFDLLAEGVAVIDGFQQTFFSPGFGMVQDRFGTRWMISVPPGA